MSEIPDDLLELGAELYESVVDSVAGTRDTDPMPEGGWKGAFTRAVAKAILAERQRVQLQPMDTAPLDGKHCILAVQEGAFIYSVQGSFDGKRWNAVHAVGVKPLCWMPNVLLPDHLAPASFRAPANTANGTEA